MKKILAILLALCLTMALTCTAFADNSPTPDPSPFVPSVDPGAGASSDALNKFTYSAVDANGAPVMISVANIESGAEYDEVKAYGVKGVYSITVLSATTGPITINVYCKGATSSCKVIVRDAWELLEDANLKVSGDRVTFNADAEMINQYHYFAVVDSFEATTVDTPTESGDNTEEVEGDDVTVNDTPAPAPEKNPTTGVALAVVPMIVAAAAIVASKKR